LRRDLAGSGAGDLPHREGVPVHLAVEQHRSEQLAHALRDEEVLRVLRGPGRGRAGAARRQPRPSANRTASSRCGFVQRASKCCSPALLKGGSVNSPVQGTFELTDHSNVAPAEQAARPPARAPGERRASEGQSLAASQSRPARASASRLGSRGQRGPKPCG